MMGTTPEQAAEQLLAAGADLVGANCGQGDRRLCRDLPPLARGLRPAGLDQGQRRPARVVERQAGLPADARGVRGLRAGLGPGRGRFHRRLLRHHARVHRRRAAGVAKGIGD